MTTICPACHESREVVFKELLRAATRQSKHSAALLCPSCYRGLDSYRDAMRGSSLNALPAITAGASERSRALWREPSYRDNHGMMVHGHSEESKAKMAAAVRARFSDPLYVARVRAARRLYWDDPQYAGLRRWDTTKFVQRAREIHGERYEYGHTDYRGFRHKVTIGCRHHGRFEQLPGHHIYFANGCPACAAAITSSAPENDLADWVAGLGLATVRHDRDVLGGLELDILVPAANLAVEYHGIHWHSYGRAELGPERYRHHYKATLADRAGVTLLQFYEDEWRDKRTIVESIISSKLGLTQRIGARSLSVRELTDTQAAGFFGEYHLRGHRQSSACFSLCAGERVVTALSLAPNGHTHEIIRYATGSGITVVGGLSRLLAAAGRSGIANVFTYADRRYSTAAGYLAVGFRLLGITPPGYRYAKGGVTYSRQRFQKHKLVDLLPGFDPSLTEAENMFRAGYRRLWDAGHYRLEWSSR